MSQQAARREKKSLESFDYEQKYAGDLPGEEVGEYARVWLTYLDETEQYDRDKVESWKNTIDILLVFAGLFSAVVTTFVIESTQNLKTNYAQVSADLLFELVQIQRAVMNGVLAESISPSPINPNTLFVPSIADSVINALWFTSLALALVTALLAVLTKQWLYQYNSLISGTPRERSRLQQFRSKGLETWKVAIIVELLPVLMHGALGLFLAGLVIFLIPLKTEIAWIIGVIACITYICYVVSALLPIFDPQCPYTTILTNFFRNSGGLAQHYWHIFLDSGISYRVSEEVHTVVVKQLPGLVINAISSILSSCLQWVDRNKIHLSPSPLWIYLSSSPPWILYLEIILRGVAMILLGAFRAVGIVCACSMIPLMMIFTLLSIFFTQILALIIIAITIMISFLIIYPITCLRTAVATYDPRFQLSKRPVQLQNSRERERAIVQQKNTSLDIDAISSLYLVSTNPSVRKIVNQSICALPYGINERLLIPSSSFYENLWELVHEEDYLSFHVDTLNRLVLGWLHYGNTVDTDLIPFLGPQRIEPYHPELAGLCAFLEQDPIEVLMKSMDSDTTTSCPLVVWSFLFRHAEYKDALALRENAALARALLTWPTAKNLFTWSDSKITLVAGQESMTLSQLSTKYPDMIGKWTFNYLSTQFRVSIDRNHIDFILLGDILYTRYSLFKAIYGVLTGLNLDPIARTNGFMQNSGEIFSLVQNFKTYVMSIATGEPGWSSALGRLAEDFEKDIMWSETFFEDSMNPQTRAHLIQIYDFLPKARNPRPIRENAMRCIYDYVVRLNASPTTESQTAALQLLQSSSTLHRLCRFLRDLEDPRLDLVLMHARRGMTSKYAPLLLIVYLNARSPSTLYRILHNPFVLEELCKCMVIAGCSDHLLEIARSNPSDPGWKDCYKNLLKAIKEEFYSGLEINTTGEDNNRLSYKDRSALRQFHQAFRDNRPELRPFHEIYRKMWFSLYTLCYHLRFILKIDLSGDEFTLRELSDMFPETFSQLSQNQTREFNALVLENKQKMSFPRYKSMLYRGLARLFKPEGDPDENDNNTSVQISPV